MKAIWIHLVVTLCVIFLNSTAFAADDLLEDLSDELPQQQTQDLSPAPSPEIKETHSDETPKRTSQVTDERDPRIPLYQYTHPHWGFELAGSYNSLGGQNLVTFQTETAKALSIQLEYQPEFLQSLGVIGLGPSLSTYPIFGYAVTSHALALWSVGGQIRYQARFFRQQPIVPIAGYSVEYFTYRFQPSADFPSASAPSGNFILQGPVVGAWLLLNIFEPSAAASLYTDYKISRSYLVAELRSQTGGDSNISITGNSFYLGLRFEF